MTSIWEDPEFLAWFEATPPKVQEAIRRAPPVGRYKLKDQEDNEVAHYEIHSYNNPSNPDLPVTITCVKVYNPGFPMPSYGVFGIAPEDLVPIQD